jgi:hypothetical protein
MLKLCTLSFAVGLVVASRVENGTFVEDEIDMKDTQVSRKNVDFN